MTAPSPAALAMAREIWRESNAAALDARTDGDFTMDAEMCRQGQLDDTPTAQASIAVIAAALSKTEALVEACKAFISKYDECEPHINDAFLHRQLRCGEYTGPQFGEELKALRNAVALVEGGGA